MESETTRLTHSPSSSSFVSPVSLPPAVSLHFFLSLSISRVTLPLSPASPYVSLHPPPPPPLHSPICPHHGLPVLRLGGNDGMLPLALDLRSPGIYVCWGYIAKAA